MKTLTLDAKTAKIAHKPRKAPVFNFTIELVPDNRTEKELQAFAPLFEELKRTVDAICKQATNMGGVP